LERDGEFLVRVSYYYNGRPNKYATAFCPFVDGVEFLHNECDKNVDFIYCGSSDPRGCLKNAVDAKVKFRKPLICFVWDIPYSLPGLEGAAIQSVNMLWLCDHIISASKNTQKVLHDRYKIKSAQLYFYVADLDIIQSISDDIEKIAQIIQIGRYVPHKRHEWAIKVIKNFPHIKLVCIGTGQSDPGYYEGIQKIAPANVDFRYGVSKGDLLTAIKQSKLLISSSSFEGFGLPPIEATFLGTPVALNDIPVFREVYGDEIPYYVCEAELHDIIEEVTENDILMGPMVQKAAACTLNFTPQDFAKRWKDECTQLLSNSK